MKTDMRILITGTHGFVGARTMRFFPDAIAVPTETVRKGGAALTRFVYEQHPELIIHTAAISDIGTCEENPEASYRANVELPVTLARAAADIGAKLLSFSSDQVYTGCTEEGPYNDAMLLPTPTNVYARHKLEAEARVLEISPDAVLLRATWMYDMPLYGHANRGNFLVNTLRTLARGNEFSVCADDHRGITYVRQVVSHLALAAQLPGGVYNYGSENPLDMYETTAALLEALGASAPITRTTLRHHNLWMDCSKLRRHGIVFDTTAEGFARCAADYGLKL